ncbi:hypothetical protein F2Q69_00035640 [Brassica cretica]|uniref:Uncharacterized protein n=1 Tax=Brassica cretica TaxID=69181 RepID=A0A8S9SKH3_BRACR|nr:hypothetical protein F2Q69_00035640 [Brassica cretica]
MKWINSKRNWKHDAMYLSMMGMEVFSDWQCHEGCYGTFLMSEVGNAYGMSSMGNMANPVRKSDLGIA